MVLMALILGLDVSTSVTGACIIDSSVEPDPAGTHIRLLDRIEFKGCATLWDKADYVSWYFDDLIHGSWLRQRRQTPPFIAPTDAGGPAPVRIDRIVLEEPLMGFRPGMSSAQTITQLMRFNGIVSYIARRTFQQDPEYVSAPHARKLCGIKLQKTSVAGPQKEQVFAHMMANDLRHVTWPVKKSGSIVDWSRDACDAYVIARAAVITGIPATSLGTHVRAKKSKRPSGL